MPTYYARGVSAHLGAMPLADTITHNMVLRKGTVARQQCEAAEKRLLESKHLTEERVFFPGDEAAFELNWLGNAPFMQVQAGRDLFQPTDEKGNLALKSHDGKPRALVLHVQLSNKTFASGMDSIRTQLKIDVFFNGQLSSCLFFPIHDVRSGAKSIHQVFAGTRIDFLAERPWVVLPPGVTADGNMRRVNKVSSAQQRWQQICQALQNESDERGKDKAGSISPSAEFLTALANMQMPAQVREMQKPDGRQFGVIDLVISAGNGRKVTSGTSYLKAPQRLADENYPFSFGSDGAMKQLYSAEPSPEIIDIDAERDSDSCYEPQPKGRASTPNVLSMQSVPKNSTLKLRSNSFMSMQVPAMLPPNQSSPSPAARDEHQRYTFSTIQNGGQTRLSSSPERIRAHNEDQDAIVRANSTPQALYSEPNSGSTFAHTPHMRASPGSLQFPNPVLGQGSPSDLMNLMPLGSGGPVSNSIDSHITPLSRYPTPSSHSRISIGSHFHAPSLSPHTPPYFGPHGMIPFTGFSFPPPPYSRSATLLPPKGLYTVPTKPKTRIYSPKGPRLIDQDNARSSILVNRLVVTGKNGATLVDHRWSIAQRVAVHWDASNADQSPDRACLSSKEHPVRSTEHAELAIGVRRSRRGTVQMPPLPPTCPVTMDNASPHKRLRNTTGDEQTQKRQKLEVADLALTSVPSKQSSSNIYNATVGDIKLSAPNVMATSLKVTRPAPQRCTATSTGILGVQGPKATPFWLEDPEVVLREAARLRRSMSPTKRKTESAVVPQSKPSAPVPSSMGASEKVPSSPLSSAPTTPDPEVVHVLKNVSAEVATLSPSNTAASIVQVDASPKRKTAPTLPRTPQFDSKLTSTATRQLQAQGPTTPKSSPSRNTKEQKTFKRYMPKQPRSPDRLKTVDNPPLNTDCVIAYAESEDKDSKRGVLRQVKGERQGVFQEEYVVFATRFFLAGE
ncbi:uncharacterized protein K460DRAFT_273943 [Cucurbitaria berberidis CBS 394.84]|uniref:Uncharacterized protein n=1 Tax=Cucurbitaria berberidis CBS 394.84 TaxID=1168544 RepID=A0A9P4LET7_9PLEO|nr:uncharacterized protein K460DRAFT_273943 [Cucurbitaria berberidis CBS 394.84]KAF1851389.1 hypothetical protein K460DRAFT_273943 [Cucurbitaria berberidis CBS 394.84]